MKSKIKSIMLSNFRTCFFDFNSLGVFWQILALSWLVTFKIVAHIFPISGDHNYCKIQLNFSEQFPNEMKILKTSSLCLGALNLISLVGIILLNETFKAINATIIFESHLLSTKDNLRTKLWCLKFSKNATKLLLAFLP